MRFGSAWVQLTTHPAGTCVGADGPHAVRNCRHVVDPNTGTEPGVIGTQERGSGHGTLVSGLYRGDGDPVGAVLRWKGTDGDQHSARGSVLTLAGHPGWAAYAVQVVDDSTLWPERVETHTRIPAPRVTLYDANGEVVASPNPPSEHRQR